MYIWYVYKNLYKNKLKVNRLKFLDSIINICRERPKSKEKENSKSLGLLQKLEDLKID